MKRIGWILLGVACVVLLPFSLIGILHTFPGTPVKRVSIAGAAESQPRLTDPLFRETSELFTGLRLTEGNEVEILLNEEVLLRLFADLRAARRSIVIRTYYSLPGAVADTFATILVERARAGVPVLFLYDAIGSEFESGYVERLRAAGVRARPLRPVRWYNLNRAQNRSHVRAIVIDGRIGYTGGFGIADKWIGDGLSPESWRETSVRFVGPAVMSLQATFSIGWAEATGTLLAGRGYFPAEGFSPAGPRVAGLLHTIPSQGSTSAERFLALSIAGAARTLYITNSYFVPDDDQRRLLVAAARRGVDVRILTAGRHTDMRSVRLAGRATYGELLRGGVRIYEYHPSMIHAKTMVADGLWSTVGTMNFDNRSAALNEESNLVMMDAGMGARLDSIFFRDLSHSREILLDDFLRRPWYDRLLEWGATRMSRIL